MIAHWFSTNPLAAGIATFALMWSDWLLTVWQQKERDAHGSDHTRTYPLDTIEGNPLVRSAVQKKHLFTARHVIAALLISAAVSLGLVYAPPIWRVPMLGYVWGLFLIVDTTHIGNLIGYRACRRGTHGQLWLHQRTAFLVQAGRYTALAILLLTVAALSGSPFVSGIAVAGISTVFRQLVWLRRVPAIASDDAPPTANPEKPNQQPPLRMPASGTPAANAPVAPPPGIAGR
jgi:hypothetical protein